MHYVSPITCAFCVHMPIYVLGKINRLLPVAFRKCSENIQKRSGAFLTVFKKKSVFELKISKTISKFFFAPIVTNVLIR